MSFSVQLTPDFIPVEPGATTPVSVVVVNKSDEQDRFELEIEGVDPEWTAVPVPTFACEAQETHTEKIFFKPGRTSESLSGNYPFVLRVRSLISGDFKTVQAILQVKEFNHVTMEINPKKGQYSAWKKQNDFSAIIVNLGNTEHTMQLTGSDPEDHCAYEFDTDQVTIGPGQQKEVEFLTTPTSASPFSSGRLIGFSITGRSVNHPNVVASAQAQLEQRPFMTLTSLSAVVLVAIVVGLWLLMMPKPLKITGFNVNPQVVQKGQNVTVIWTTQQATHIRITAGADVVYDGNQQSGSAPYSLTVSGDVPFRIVANRDQEEKAQDIHLTVKELPPTPDPEILTCKVSGSNKVKLGNSFELDYTFNGAVASAKLEPTGQDLDLTVNRILIKPDTVGDTTYTISASNADRSKTAKKDVVVSVYEESDATIIAFTPSNNSIPASVGRVTLSWQVSGAVRVELATAGGSTQPVDSSGELTVPITTKTVYTLTAYDPKGRKTSKSTTVNFVPDIPPPTDGTTAGATTGGATTNSGDTGGSNTDGGRTGSTTTSTTAGGVR